MFKNILSLVIAVCLTASLTAQQLTHPLEFVVTAPTSAAGNYDYGYAADWGPTAINTTCADLAWGYTAAGNSIGCTPIVTDLTGKIALISRGACNFSLKAYHAQAAGAVGTIIINLASNPATEIVNMAGGDSATAVTTPAVFLAHGTALPITSAVDAGQTVNACFKVPVLGSAQGIYHYSTPVAQVTSLDSFWITAFNTGSVAETNVTLNVDIEDPNGTTTNYSTNWGTIGAGSEQEIAVGSGFVPSVLGTHNVTYTVTSDAGTYNNESVSKAFEVTPLTFANDNPSDIRGGIVIAGFDTDLRYGVGNYFFTYTNSVATHASFALDNVPAMHGEQFVVTLYNADADGDGTLDANTFSGLTPVGFNTVVIDSTLYNSGDTMLVGLISATGLPIDLVADGAYIIHVDYDAFTSPVGNLTAPEYVHSFDQGYRFLNTVVSNSDDISQWSAGIGNALVRLHLDGYVTTSTKDVALLDDAAFSIYPNPATTFVTLDLNLEEMSQDVNVKILDINGRELQNFNYANISNNKYQYSVDQLPAGTYFLRVQTDEGFRTKHFVVIK